MLTITSPITGTAQTGFSSPTYTVVEDYPPDRAIAKQFAVSAIGGTQSGVTTHSIQSPFTLTWVKPRSFKTLGLPNAQGVISNAGKNTWKLIVRKGVTPAANQAPQFLLLEVSISIPAGAEVFDKTNVQAAIASCIGALNQQSAALGDTVSSGLF